MDIYAKINNALSDKRNRVNQYKEQINQKNQEINALNEQLNALRDNRLRVQRDLGPEGVLLNDL